MIDTSNYTAILKAMEDGLAVDSLSAFYRKTMI